MGLALLGYLIKSKKVAVQIESKPFISSFLFLQRFPTVVI